MLFILFSSAFVVLVSVLFTLRPLHLVHVGGLKSSIYWTVRSWLWGYPVTSEYPGLWYTGDPNNTDEFYRQLLRLVRVWGFLRPFFRSHGYELFVTDPKDVWAPLLPPTPPSTQPQMFPFAQNFYRQDADAGFVFLAPRVWAARDSKGRDVVIKALSGSKPEHTELLAMRALNSAPLLDHPSNHTIPLLDLLVFHGQVFAIMPRWDVVTHLDFTTVGQIMRHGLAFLEVRLSHFHEHNISHGDISVQNMVKDAVHAWGAPPQDICGPERRYAFIDFETARFNPDPIAYRQDVYKLALVLERTLMCAADDIPTLIPLLSDMKSTSMSASDALSRFSTILSSVPEATLRTRTTKMAYSHGIFQYRKTNEDLAVE